MFFGCSVRSIVILNLDCYGGGRHPWGHPMPEYLEKAAAIKLELRGGAWNKAYMQMDGEPWKQPLKREYSTFMKIERVPSQSRMI
ncbi:hypothetical protein B296_00042514, partial [Ensete ventricosum]